MRFVYNNIDHKLKEMKRNENCISTCLSFTDKNTSSIWKNIERNSWKKLKQWGLKDNFLM